MTTKRRRGQTSFDDWFAFGGIPRPETLMDPVLRRIDPVLDDVTLVDAVFTALTKRHKQSAHTGRPSTPAEVVLRLLVLKHIRSWSYEQLQWEVTGNYVYRRFCRIDGGDVPDAKTMVRYGQLLDGDVLKQIFDRVVEVARVRGVSKGRRLRVDTTVVEAPIHYPTDSSLCADSVRVLSREMGKLEEAGTKLPFVRTDVRRGIPARVLTMMGAASKPRTENDRASGFATVHVKSLIPMLPVPPDQVVPGVSASDLLKSIDDPITASAQSTTLDLNVPLGDVAPWKALLQHCTSRTRPPHSTRSRRRCRPALSNRRSSRRPARGA